MSDDYTKDAGYRPVTAEVIELPTRFGNPLQTASGILYWPMDPRPEEVFIEDIASSLSKLCRYNGHCKFFYSVAEHSVWCAQALWADGHDPLTCLTGLMHDATEAYVADVPRPLKPYLTGYAEIEQRNWVVIAKRFGLPEVMPQAVHQVDDEVLLAEKPVLMGDSHKWTIPGRPADVRIQGWDPGIARYAFLREFEKLSSMV